MGKEFTHDDLLIPAEKLLRKNGKIWKCSSTFIELVTYSNETPDVFGFASTKTSLAEVKVSRPDFLADQKKRCRIYPEEGMGNYRFYICPEGLINPEEIPEKWGLAYFDGKKCNVIVRPEYQPSNRRNEITFASSVMRRLEATKELSLEKRRSSKSVEVVE